MRHAQPPNESEISMTVPTTTPEFWAAKKRSLDRYTVKECRDCGDKYEFRTVEGTAFLRSKADIGEPFAPGDQFDLETVNWSTITGLKDAAGRWRFHLTDQDLADEHIEWLRASEERKSVELEKNMREYARQEAELPDWLKARIQRFRDAAGEQFLRDGWGYELAVCRLAALMAAGDDAGAEEMSRAEGVTGNQWGCAKLLAELHATGHDYDAAQQIPAALAPITGSADYS